MFVPEQTERHPITRKRWAEIVARHTDPVTEMSVKRKHQRFNAMGSARLAFTMDDGSGEVPFIRTCTVLQVSVEGLMVRSQEELPRHTPIAIDLYLGDDTYLVWGEVMHSTQTVGAMKIGVRLTFADP